MGCAHPKKPTRPVLHLEVNPIGILLANRTAWDRGRQDVGSLAKGYQPRNKRAGWYTADHPGEGREGRSGGQKDRRSGNGDGGHSDRQTSPWQPWSPRHGTNVAQGGGPAPGSSFRPADTYGRRGEQSRCRTRVLLLAGRSCRVRPVASSEGYPGPSSLREVPGELVERGARTRRRARKDPASVGVLSSGQRLSPSRPAVSRADPWSCSGAYGIPRTKTAISEGPGSVTGRRRGEQRHQSILPAREPCQHFAHPPTVFDSESCSPKGGWVRFTVQRERNASQRDGGFGMSVAIPSV